MLRATPEAYTRVNQLAPGKHTPTKPPDLGKYESMLACACVADVSSSIPTKGEVFLTPESHEVKNRGWLAVFKNLHQISARSPSSPGMVLETTSQVSSLSSHYTVLRAFVPQEERRPRCLLDGRGLCQNTHVCEAPPESPNGLLECVAPGPCNYQTSYGGFSGQQF